MKKLLSSVLLVMSGICLANAQNKSVPRPKLVIGIVVDQMRWDYLYRYYDRFGNDGFKRLLNKGFSCQNTFLNYVPSYTAPGHATIYTGSVPAIHGIVGNDWIDVASGQNRYCAQDDTARGIGQSAVKTGRMSPVQMKTSTVGDELRLATNFKSKVFGVALKDRGAIFPAGHSANGAFWMDDSTGNFISSSYYSENLPEWLTEFNSKKWVAKMIAQQWETLYPIETYQQSIADDNSYEEVEKGEKLPVFPHIVNTENLKNIRSLPAGNTLTLKLARALLRGEHMGNNAATDLLTISLSATDYVGHAYGPNSVEVEDLYLRLDKDLAAFLHTLDEEVGEGNYLLFLSADHGAAHNARFLQDNKMSAGLLSEYDMKRELNAAAMVTFGKDSLVRAVMNYQVFLNEIKIDREKMNREALKDFLVKKCGQYKGMAQVIDIEDLNKSPLPEFLRNVIQNGYNRSRCGSISLVYEPAWYSDGPKGTTHGTWNPYDAHIPLLWYGWHIPQGASFRRTEVIDIAATLSALLHIQMPNGASGNVIEDLVD